MRLTGVTDFTDSLSAKRSKQTHLSLIHNISISLAGINKIVNQTPPEVQQSRISWQVSRLILPRLGILNAVRGWLTIWDSFGSPGDTISTSTIARQIRKKFPKIKINCITPNPELLQLVPEIDSLNAPAGLVVLRCWYLDLIAKKDGSTNILAPTLAQVGIRNFEYRAQVFLSREELKLGRARVARLEKPIITLNTESREKVKMWFGDRWAEVARILSTDYSLVQLGTDKEPELPGVFRLAGELSMRESAAVIANAKLHLGGVSFLMHVANGLGIPAVIIYGGRETPANSGYDQNTNLYVRTACSPCWLHDSRGEQCQFEMECMRRITVDEVVAAVRKHLTAPLPR